MAKRSWYERRSLSWAGALLVTALFFYALDHVVMEAQGLGLNSDLSPAQQR